LLSGKLIVVVELEQKLSWYFEVLPTTMLMYHQFEILISVALIKAWPWNGAKYYCEYCSRGVFW